MKKSERAFLTIVGATDRQIREFDAKHKPTVPKGDPLQHRLWVSTPSLVLVQPNTKEGNSSECKPGEFILRHIQSSSITALEPLGSRLRVRVRDVRFKGVYHVAGEEQKFAYDYQSELAIRIINESKSNSPEQPTMAFWGPEWLLETDAGNIMRWFVHHLHTKIDSIGLLDSEESIVQSQSFEDGKSRYFLSRVFGAPRQTQP